MKIKLFLTMIMGLCATAVCAQTWPYQDACETVQVYVRNLADNEGPLKTLRAYQQVSLAPGESKTLTIDFPRERFEGWDAATNTMRVLPGQYELLVGNSSAPQSLHKLPVTLE